MVFANDGNSSWQSCPASALQTSYRLDHALFAFEDKEFCLPPPAEALKRCSFSMSPCSANELASIFQVLRRFSNLQALNLVFEPDGEEFWQRNVIIGTELQDSISETISRLRSLTLQGYLPVLPAQSKAFGEFLRSLDLSRLEVLRANCVNVDLWDNETLISLGEFSGGYSVGGPEDALSDSQKFRDYLGRTKSLRILKAIGIKQYGGFPWLGALPPQIHTLGLDLSEDYDIKDQSSRIQHRTNLLTVAERLPSLTDLTIVAKEIPGWAYAILEDVATTLPNVVHLTLCPLSPVGTRPTLSTLSRAWKFYWKTLSNKGLTASPARGPSIRSLTFATKGTDSLRPNGRYVPDDKRHLLACLVDDEERAKNGEAKVSSERVENLVQALGDNDTDAEMQYTDMVMSIYCRKDTEPCTRNDSIHDKECPCRNKLRLERRVADLGLVAQQMYSCATWPDELDRQYGRARLVVPEEGDDDARKCAAEDFKERDAMIEGILDGAFW